MRIAEIPGPSKLAGHVGEHQVVSLEHGADVPMIAEVGGRHHAGQPTFSDFRVVIKKSTMTNRFTQFVMGAEPIPKVEITSLLEDGSELMTLTGVHVRAIKERSEGGGPTLVYLTLAYDEIRLVTRDSAGKDLDVVRRDQAHWRDR
jgi:type VI protein secretion system component Hcp